MLLATGCARQHFFQADARLPATAGLPAVGRDSVWATAGRQYNEHGGFYKIWLGPHHRAVWAAPVRVPVLDLATAVPAAGPLVPTKLGGGFQSTSLTLTAANGVSYVARSLDKDPARILPRIARKTFAANYMRDATSAGNPYGALVAAPLAAALGVPHSHPRLFYVPLTETALNVADANERLRGKLVLLEEKYSGKRVQSAEVPAAKRFVDSEEMRQRLYDNPADRPDEQALLRARLLDVLIGDWDRHTGQWQWAELPDPARPGGQRFAPVPKDRDQAFFRISDGVIPWLISRKFTVRHLVTFKPRIHDVVALTGQGRFVDQRGLPSRRGRDFAQAAAYVQQHLPDSTLARAVRQLPPAVYALEGPRLLHDLQARRAQLPAVAQRYYALKARYPVAAGTNQPDYFLVTRTPDSTTVQVYSRTLGADSLYFQRTYLKGETRYITLEGLGGDDIVQVTGGKGLPLRIHGGAGRDVLRPGNAARVRFGQEANGDLPDGSAADDPHNLKRYDRLEDEHAILQPDKQE